MRTRGRWAGNGDVSGMGREGARWDGRRRDVWRGRAQNTQTCPQTSTLSLCLAHVWTLLRHLIRITGCPRPRSPPWGRGVYKSSAGRETRNCLWGQARDCKLHTERATPDNDPDSYHRLTGRCVHRPGNPCTPSAATPLSAPLCFITMSAKVYRLPGTRRMRSIATSANTSRADLPESPCRNDTSGLRAATRWADKKKGVRLAI